MNDTLTSKIPTSGDVVCPSCGRFVGAFDRCPYCGTGIQRRMTIRFFRYLALVVAIVGMICLHAMAMYRTLPVTTIGAITPTMNFGYFSVIGRAAQSMRFFREDGKVTRCALTLRDDSGEEIRVTGYRKVAETLVSKGIAIRQGDKVKVSGTVRVTETATKTMMLQVADHLEVLESRAPAQAYLAELANYADGDAVRLRGTITGVVTPRSPTAPYRLLIEDTSGTGELVLWQSTWEELSARQPLTPGLPVEARASVSAYHGQSQLRLESSDDLTVLAAAAANAASPAASASAAASANDATPAASAPAAAMAPVRLGTITSADVGKRVTVTATIGSQSAGRGQPRAVHVDAAG